MKGEKNKTRTTKSYQTVVKKRNVPKTLSSTMATCRQCHYILFKHKSNVHNKEAILWSACFNVPLGQIKNSNLKVRNGIFDEPRRGKMIAHFTELKKKISMCLWPRRCDSIKLTENKTSKR